MLRSFVLSVFALTSVAHAQDPLSQANIPIAGFNLHISIHELVHHNDVYTQSGTPATGIKLTPKPAATTAQRTFGTDDMGRPQLFESLVLTFKDEDAVRFQVTSPLLNLSDAPRVANWLQAAQRYVRARFGYDGEALKTLGDIGELKVGSRADVLRAANRESACVVSVRRTTDGYIALFQLQATD
jgi:hypothetical protein